MSKEFLGMKIVGEGGQGEGNRVEQYSTEIFQEVVSAVLSHDEVSGICWNQYTPYFNDGEPCVFRVGEVYFSLVGAEKEDYFEYDWMEEDFNENGRIWCNDFSPSFKKIIGNIKKIWNRPPGEWDWAEGSGPMSAPDLDLFLDVISLKDTMDKGHFNHAVEDLFGDHAFVKIDKLSGKVLIEEYEHD
jgi:hypothetical protein